MNLKSNKAVTLIELLVVIAVLGILMGLMVSVGPQALNKAKEGKAKSMIASLEIAISMYHADTGVYPATTLTAMVSSLKTDPGAPVSGWAGAYMDFKIEDYQNENPASNTILDPWGNPYNYVTPGVINASYDLWSNGSNGDDNSTDGAPYDDDVYNW